MLHRTGEGVERLWVDSVTVVGKNRIDQILDEAMLSPTGGIDLEKTAVQSTGGGVMTAFDDSAQLTALRDAAGLKGIIYKVEPVTLPMLNMFLGLKTGNSSPSSPGPKAALARG